MATSIEIMRTNNINWPSGLQEHSHPNRKTTEILMTSKMKSGSVRVMNKSQVAIGSGFILLLIGVLSGVQVLNRFEPVFDGDSIIPDTIAVLSDFKARDYFFFSLMAGSLFIGLSLLLSGGISLLIKNTKDRQISYQSEIKDLSGGKKIL